LLKDRTAPLYVVCKSGQRSEQACKQLAADDPNLVIRVDGGMNALEGTGIPVVHGKKAMSLERQVRIAAGFLVATGTALGAFVHPGFLGIPAFVGVGLMFAGITDWCGMGLLIAKMPWNR
jgi:rhodanese-related sulfurtransferase